MKESQSIRQTLSAARAATTLRIHYPEMTISDAAANISVVASAPTPRLSISASALKQPTLPGAKYLAISIDLDPPFPSFSVLGPGLHGLQADLVTGAVDADGFVALEGSTEWQVMPYAGPGPPKLSAPHRYMFMVFEQPQEMDAARVKRLLGLEGKGTGVMPRIRWDQEAAEKKLGLGEAVAGNYYLTRS